MKEVLDSLCGSLVAKGVHPRLLPAAAYLGLSAGAAELAPALARLELSLRSRSQPFLAGAAVEKWRREEAEVLDIGRTGYRVRLSELDLEDGVLAAIRDTLARSQACTIGEFDQDGRLLSAFGAVDDLPAVDAQDFMPRHRFLLELTVDSEETVGVRKFYRGDQTAFVSEMAALHDLTAAGCNVPAILAIEFESPALTVSFVRGQVVREALVARGARLRDGDADREASWAGFTPAQVRLLRIAEGRRHLGEVVGESFVDGLLEQVRKIHARGYFRLDIKYGNVIVERSTGAPYLVDFESAFKRRSGDDMARTFGDADIDQVNLHFGRSELTRGRLKSAIQADTVPTFSRTYAPVSIGTGLRIGQVLRTDAGYGRWHFILKKNLPDWHGRRILDLGANNGSCSLQMLREGARQAVALELDGEFIEQGRFLKAAFEWADGKSYDFAYVNADIADLPSMDLGRFDFVMALCSIYYLDDAVIANVVRHVSTISDCLVLQCNTASDIGRASEETYRKASVDYAARVLSENGFPRIRVVAPRWYSRPLVMGWSSGEQGTMGGHTFHTAPI